MCTAHKPVENSVTLMKIEFKFVMKCASILMFNAWKMIKSKYKNILSFVDAVDSNACSHHDGGGGGSGSGVGISSYDFLLRLRKRENKGDEKQHCTLAEEKNDMWKINLKEQFIEQKNK